MPETRASGPGRNRLRLASAQRKLRAFLDQVEALEASDFPHGDAEDALATIKKKFLERRRQIERILPGSPAVDTECESLIRAVTKYTSTLGLILRSTNVRNHFEIYYPLRVLVEKLVPGTKLILSSEWDLFPFTFPVGHMDEFIFIGSPATEADDILIVPLAAHEIGHSVWNRHNIARKLDRYLSKAVVKHLQSQLPGMSEEFDTPPASRRGPGKPSRPQETEAGAVQDAYDLAWEQAQEVFCDLIALYTFDDGYIYAHEHIMAPGGLYRDESYPDSQARVEYIRKGAEFWSVKYDPRAIAGWKPSEANEQDWALDVADAAVRDVVPQLIRITDRLMGRVGIPRNDPVVVAQIRRCFQARIPYEKLALLSEIVSAGWQVLRNEGGLGAGADKKRHDSLQEVMLKSMELSEFSRRLEDAERRKNTGAS